MAVVRLGRQVIVLEYLRGGQLYDSLHRLGGSEQPYTEQAAAAIFAQVNKAAYKKQQLHETDCTCQTMTSGVYLRSCRVAGRPPHASDDLS